MNNRPFPPIVLTHITKDNALFHKACKSGVNIFIETHNLSHLTAISVTLLLKSKKLTSETKAWVKSIAGLNLKNGDEEGYGNGDELGYEIGNVEEYGDGNGEEYVDGDGYRNGLGYGYGYGYGYKDGDGYGYGYGDVYKDGYGYGYGNGDGEEYVDGDGYRNGLGYGNEDQTL